MRQNLTFRNCMTELTIDDIFFPGLKAVVFDLDGTLYKKKGLPLWLIVSDLPHVCYLASERVARRKLKGQYFGTPEAFYDSLFRHISSRLHIPLLWARNWYFSKYLPLTVDILSKHYHGGAFVEPLLRELRRRGIETAVFSDYHFAAEKLRALDIDPDLFDFVLASTDMGGLKPNKTLFEKVLRTMGVSADEALMVGDREDTDGDGARSVGMRYRKV